MNNNLIYITALLAARLTLGVYEVHESAVIAHHGSF
jgi:hypothetical protein